MEIYLLRHGIAENLAPGGSDADRRLTDEGRNKLRIVLERAKRADVTPTSILSSPLVRAIQTAEIAAAVLGYRNKIIQTGALLPEASPQDVWSALRDRRDESGVLLVGHEPLFSSATAYLLGEPGLQLDFKKGALVRIDVDRFSGEPRGVLRWMLTPKLAG